MNKKPACRGYICEHFHVERMSGVFDDGTSRVWHDGDESNPMFFMAGDMPEGTCEDGHDARMERLMAEAMARAGCEVTR